MIKVIIHVAKAAIAAIAALLLSSCGMDFSTLEGSGNVTTQKRNVGSEFRAVTAGAGIEVVIEQGGERTVTVEADDNLQEHIKTEVKDGTLVIESDARLNDSSTKRVTVRMPEIEKIESESGAVIRNKGTLIVNKLSLEASSGSSIDLVVDAKEITCESGSGSSLKVSGKADDLQADAGSGSNLNARGLAAQTVEAEASSGSTVIVNPLQDLSADASSGGKVLFVNTPENLNKKTSSGGDVSQE
jgi:hypothetical protein